MEKLVIKIGADPKEDMKKVFENPKKYGSPNTHTLYLKNSESLYRILSPQRLELLRRLIKYQSEKKTVGELAKELGRKQEAISRDASFLAMHQLIKKVKNKREVYLKALYKSLDIRLASA